MHHRMLGAEKFCTSTVQTCHLLSSETATSPQFCLLFLLLRPQLRFLHLQSLLWKSTVEFQCCSLILAGSGPNLCRPLLLYVILLTLWSVVIGTCHIPYAWSCALQIVLQPIISTRSIWYCVHAKVIRMQHGAVVEICRYSTLPALQPVSYATGQQCT